MTDRPVAVITGASGGIGLAAAELFFNKGYKVYGLNRRTHDNGKICYIAANVTQPQSVRNAIARIWEIEHRIDVLVNNAGFGISGAIEYTKIEDARKQMDVNFFGMFTCAQAVLPYMRAQRRGHIINVSSVAAVIPIPFQAFYSASKAAINTMTLALANEVRPYGICVSALMPGDVRTGFTASREKSTEGMADYPALERSVAMMEKDEQNGMPPEYIARLLYGIARRNRPKPLYASGLSYRILVLLNRLLPVRLANRVIGLIYAR